MNLPVAKLRLRILVDRSVVEIFADDGRTVVTRIVFAKKHDCRVRLDGDCQAEAAMYRLAL